MAELIVEGQLAEQEADRVGHQHAAKTIDLWGWQHVPQENVQGVRGTVYLCTTRAQLLNRKAFHFVAVAQLCGTGTCANNVWYVMHTLTYTLVHPCVPLPFERKDWFFEQWARVCDTLP